MCRRLTSSRSRSAVSASSRARWRWWRDAARPRLCAIYAVCTTVEHRRMHNSDYYREEAAKYRELADMAKDAVTKQEPLELAAACEGIADKIDDLRASG